jgi:hypothetical protein
MTWFHKDALMASAMEFVGMVMASPHARNKNPSAIPLASPVLHVDNAANSSTLSKSNWGFAQKLLHPVNTEIS